MPNTAPSSKQPPMFVVLDVDGTCADRGIDRPAVIDYNQVLFQWAKYTPAYCIFLTKMGGDERLGSVSRCDVFSEMIGQGVNLGLLPAYFQDDARPALLMLSEEAVFNHYAQDLGADHFYKAGDFYLNFIYPIESILSQIKATCLKGEGDLQALSELLASHTRVYDSNGELQALQAFRQHCLEQAQNEGQLTKAFCDNQMDAFLKTVQWENIGDSINHLTIRNVLSERLPKWWEEIGDQGATLATVVKHWKDHCDAIQAGLGPLEGDLESQHAAWMAARLRFMNAEVFYGREKIKHDQRIENLATKPESLALFDRQLREGSEGFDQPIRYFFVDDSRSERQKMRECSLSEHSSVFVSEPPHGLPMSQDQSDRACLPDEFRYRMAEQLADCYPQDDYDSRYMVWRIALLLADDPSFSPEGEKLSCREQYNHCLHQHELCPNQHSNDQDLIKKWQQAEADLSSDLSSDLNPDYYQYNIQGRKLGLVVPAFGLTVGLGAYFKVGALSPVLPWVSNLGYAGVTGALISASVVLLPALVGYLAFSFALSRCNRPGLERTRYVLQSARIGTALMPFAFLSLMALGTALSLPVTWPAVLAATVAVPLLMMGGGLVVWAGRRWLDHRLAGRKAAEQAPIDQGNGRVTQVDVVNPVGVPRSPGIRKTRDNGVGFPVHHGHEGGPDGSPGGPRK